MDINIGTGSISKIPSIKELDCELKGSISLGRGKTRLTMDSDHIYMVI